MNSSCLEQQNLDLSSTSRWRIAAGIFLVVLALYVLSSPGRIDIIDGQARFDVAYNWLQSGRPLLTDSWIRPWMAVPGRNHLPYSYYGAPASVFPMPLIALGTLYDGQSVSTSQFLFSLTSPIFGAFAALVLFLFYLELGFTQRGALLWTMINASATLLWPCSNSCFDNAQHAFFAITSIYLGFLSARRNSNMWAIAGGLSAAVLILYQDYFLLLIPIFAISTVDWKINSSYSDSMGFGSRIEPTFSGILGWIRARVETTRRHLGTHGELRASCVRYLCWCLTAVILGVGLSLLYNRLRFGSYLENGKVQFSVLRGYPIFGNPFAGLSTLLLSPGKSIFLYSPTILLGILGVRRLRKREPQLALLLVASSVVLTLFLSCIAFAGGDWCWGPRYLVVLLPLWALAFPFAPVWSRNQKLLAISVIGLGVLVQVLGLSVENQRFFFEHKLHDFFWAEDPWFYFKHSALFSRIPETASLARGAPSSAHMFNPVGVSEWCTYTLLGPSPRMSRDLAPLWMRNYKIFYLPRPWPFWMRSIAPDMRPIRMASWIAVLSGINLLGVLMILPALRTESRAPFVRWKVEEVGAV